MNPHLLEHFANDKTMDVMRSVEFFIATVIVISILGFIFLAAV